MNFRHSRIVIECAACCASMVLLVGLSTAAEAADGKTAQDEMARFGDQQLLFGRLNVLEAWEVTKGDPEILVGVIDRRQVTLRGLGISVL